MARWLCMMTCPFVRLQATHHWRLMSDVLVSGAHYFCCLFICFLVFCCFCCTISQLIADTNYAPCFVWFICTHLYFLLLLLLLLMQVAQQWDEQARVLEFAYIFVLRLSLISVNVEQQNYVTHLLVIVIVIVNHPVLKNAWTVFFLLFSQRQKPYLRVY